MEFVRRTERETEQESRRNQEENGLFPNFSDACRKCADGCLCGGKCTKFGRKHPPGRDARRIYHRRSTGRNRFFFIRRYAGETGLSSSVGEQEERSVSHSEGEEASSSEIKKEKTAVTEGTGTTEEEEKEEEKGSLPAGTFT